MTTLAMIEEFIEGHEIVGTAPHSNKHFSHAVWLGEGDIVPETGLLVCGNPESITRYLGKHPKELCLCVVQDHVIPIEISPFKQQVLILHSERGELSAFDCVQKLLLKFDAWSDAMKTSLLEGRSYQSLLTISEPILQNFISISNSQFRLIAYTKNIRIDDPVIDSLLTNGFHTKETVDMFKKLHTIKDWESQKKITLKPVSDLNVHPVFDYVFRMQGNYFLHINMHCNARKPSAGLADAFQVLIGCLEYCVKQDWNNRFSLAQEPSVLFGDLIDRKPLGKRALAERLRTVGIEPSGDFALLVVRLLGDSDTRTLLPYCVNHIKELFPSCFVGSYGPFALILDPNEATKANNAEQLRLFTEAHFCAVGISEPFERIADFPYAYQQASRAVESATNARPSLAATFDGKPDHAIYRFRDYFAYFVADTARNNSHLIEHYGQTGTVRKIVEADEQHQTDDARILYSYLKNERKASTTCAELFLHRNTLLYRIKKLEKDHGFSLDDVATRRHLLTEFLLYRD